MYRIKKFYYFTFMAKRSGVMLSFAYWSYLHYWSEILINTSGLFSRLAWSNPCAKQEKFYEETYYLGHIFQKRHTKHPGIRQYSRILWWSKCTVGKIGCKPYKTLLYHPQPNGLAERMVQNIKMRPIACSQQKEKKCFSPKTAFKLSHNTTRRKSRKPISFNGVAN